MPQHMVEQSPSLAQTIFTDGKIYQIDPPNFAKGAYFLQPHPTKSLRSVILEIVQGPASSVQPSPFGDMQSLDGCIDLICSLLTLDPSLRRTAPAAMSHPWLRSNTAWRPSTPGMAWPSTAGGRA
jgi:serine/threonine protein kinase